MKDGEHLIGTAGLAYLAQAYERPVTRFAAEGAVRHKADIVLGE